MAVDLHYNEIARAVRRSVQDGRLLTADTDGTDTVQVASTGVQAGDVVEIGDDEGCRSGARFAWCPTQARFGWSLRCPGLTACRGTRCCGQCASANQT